MQRLWRWLCPDGESGRLRLPAFVALALLTAVVLGAGRDTIPVMDRDEARYAQASKQILESGDLVHLRFQDESRLVKPILTYWLQAASAAAFGGTDAPIAAYRLPSLVAAFAAVMLTAWFGARTFGAEVGLVAGLLLALALVVQVEARTAKTDAPLLLAVVTAQLALARVALRPVGERPPFVGAPLVFWIAQALGFLIKGPIVVLVSSTTVLVYALWQRDTSLVRRIWPIRGLLVMLAIAAPWILLVTWEVGREFFDQALGRAMLSKIAQGQESHGAPPGAHGLALFLTFWPGVALLAVGAAVAWRRRAEPAVRFLVAWIVPTWLVFEAVATKLPHYPLPTFPAIALIAALGLKEAATLLEGRLLRFVHAGVVALAALAGVALAAVPSVVAFGLGTDLLGSVAAVAATFTGLVATFFLLRLGRAPAPPRLLPVVLTTGLFYVLTFTVVLPRPDALWPSDRLAARVEALEGCAPVVVATAGFAEPSNVFRLGTATYLGQGADAAAHLLAHPKCGLAVVDERQRAAFDAQLEASATTVRSVGRITGLNVSNGRRLHLELLVVDSSPLRAP